MTLVRFHGGARDLGTHIVTKTGKRVEHGSHNAYSNLGCRCPRCREAHRVYSRAKAHRLGYSKPLAVFKAERAAAVPHGTKHKYANHKCRCDKCRAWSRSDRQRFRTTEQPRDSRCWECQELFTSPGLNIHHRMTGCGAEKASVAV